MSAFITFLPLDSIESETMRHNFYSCSLLISAAISQRKITFRVKRMISNNIEPPLVIFLFVINLNIKMRYTIFDTSIIIRVNLGEKLLFYDVNKGYKH